MGELLDRREKLFRLMKENSALVLFAGVSKLASEDATHNFMSNRNFYYLTNIEQENSILLMIKGIGGEKKTYLFIDEYDCIANHSAHIGKFSDEEMFYLNSRGINDNDAIKLLITGFLTSNVDEYVKTKINDAILKYWG
jgi:hypothetical protein